MHDGERLEDVRTVLMGLSREPAEQQLRALSRIVLDLLVEVEALRSLHLTDELTRQRYRLAYEETGICAHSSLGPSSGREKVFDRFWPRAGGPDAEGFPGYGWREVLMLERFGCSTEEIEEYKRRVEAAECLS